MAVTDLVVCPPLQTYFVDKDTGAPLSAGVVTFYSQDNPTQLKNIYQQSESPSGEIIYTLLNNPIILTSVGTFADDSGNDINVFLYPFAGSPTDEERQEEELYYITVQSSGLVDQFTRMFYPPNSGSADSGSNVALSSANQITNSQFIETLFITPAEFSVSGVGTVTEIAPGWSLLTSGTGTVTVSQISIPFANNTNNTNAPYALQIESVSLDSISLFQRFQADPLLLSNGFIASYAQVASLNGSGSQSISLQYKPSNISSTSVNIVTASTNPDESFTTISGTVIALSTNTDIAPDGYVDFVVVLPKNIRIQITSIQLVGATSLSATPDYLQLSTQLQTSNLYWYDKPALEQKPVPSYLTGWDFPFNPAQFLGDSGTVSVAANKSAYIWDQTIAFQTVSNSLAFSRDSDTGSLVITPSSNTSFALVQYLGQKEAREILSQKLSVQLQASTSATTLAGTVSLYWTDDTTLPDLNAANYLSLVSGITAGVPATANGTWNKVPFIGNGNATFTLTPTVDQFSFAGFDDTASAGKTTATFFAIVVAFDTLAIASTMTIDYCSLVPGTIATRPAPQSFDQVLQQCQYYYEKSYNNDVIPGTSAVPESERRALQLAAYSGSMGGAATTITARAAEFYFSFNTIKRTLMPTVTILNPSTGNSNSVFWSLTNSSIVVSTGSVAVSTNWTQGSLGSKAVSYNAVNSSGGPTNVASVQAPNSYLSYHYTVDARLGLVI